MIAAQQDCPFTPVYDNIERDDTMTDSIRELTILQPDDWHIHLRDDKALATTVAHAAQSFNRVICMPNLVPPVKNIDDAHAYRARIMQQLEASDLSAERKAAFDPRMTL